MFRQLVRKNKALIKVALAIDECDGVELPFPIISQMLALVQEIELELSTKVHYQELEKQEEEV